MGLLNVLGKLFPSTPPAPAPDPLVGVPIECCDLDTGSVIASYESLEEAGRAGFDPSSIRTVLEGGCREYSRATWRMAPRNSPSEQSAPEASPPPVRVTEPTDVAVALLTDAHRRDELARLRQDIFFDDARHQWGVRLNSRTLYRPQRCEVVQIWYEAPEDERRDTTTTVETSAATDPPARPATPPIHAKRPGNTPRMVQALEPATNEVVKTYPSLAAVIQDGFHPKGVTRAIEGHYSQSGGYLWRDVDAPPRRTPAQQACTRAFESFDPNTGQAIKRYATLKEAELDGFFSAGIRTAIDHNWQHHGLGWRHVQTKCRKQRGGHRPAKVESYDLTTGQTIRQYESRRAAAVDDGYQPESIRFVLRGSQQQHRGVGWRYAVKEKKRVKTKGHVIEAFDPKTGKTVQAFRSWAEVAKHGFKQVSVFGVLRGTARTHHGLGWRVNESCMRRIEARCPTTGKLLFTFPSPTEIRAKGYDPALVRQAIYAHTTYSHLYWSYGGGVDA